MRGYGIDLDKLYFDVLRMRSAYPSDSLTSDIVYAFHRIEDACQAHGRTNGPRRGVQLLPWQEFGGVQ
jgi:hypothetical protein